MSKDKDASANPETPAAAPSRAGSSTSAAVAAASITDCCICLYPVTVCQALFIAPCSHVTHFKCIRPLVEQNYPGFCCPLCRTYADLEADVEIDLPEPAPAPAPSPPTGAGESEPAPDSNAMADDGPDGLTNLARRSPPMDAVLEAEEPASRAPSILASGIGRSRPPSIAPSGAGLQPEDDDDIEMDVDEGRTREGDEAMRDGDLDDDEANDGSASSTHEAAGGEADEPASHDFATSVSAMAIASPKNLRAHLSPSAQDDLYASLASAATPPNSTFLSTLADSATASGSTRASAFSLGAGRGSGASTSSIFAAGGGGGAGSGGGAAAVIPTSALARPPASLDAAVLSEAGPSTVSLARSGSGSGTHGSDDGEVDPAAVEESTTGESRDETTSAPPESEVKGKGKDKTKDKGKDRDPVQVQDKKRRSVSTSLFPPRESMDHPDPAVAAALLI